MLEALKTSAKDRYFEDIEMTRLQPAPGWLTEIRERALDRFLEFELPQRRIEEWRVTNVAPITSTSFPALIEPGAVLVTPDMLRPFLYGVAGWTELVFVDGFLAPALCRLPERSDGVQAGGLLDAVENGYAELPRHLDRCVRRSDGFFSALNSALLLDGAYVHVPAKRELRSPIHILHVRTDRQTNAAAHPRNLVVADPQSNSTIIESYVSLAGGGRYLNNPVTELVLGEMASVQIYKVVAEGAQGYHLATVSAVQAAGSKLESCTFALDGKIVRNKLATILDGENAECSLNGLYLARDGQLVDNAVSVDHARPHCTSWIGYKGVLDGNSHGVFSGAVRVRRNAQKTDSRQLNQNLLLADEATVDTKPLLEIFADDVKCTHGAAVGQPPEEILYYFGSRGIGEGAARAMLTYGFAREIIEKIETVPLRNRVDRSVYERYTP
jgi:Fe-S cluster assembly protein SufD